jgi:oligosaccharide repeat unit polymerase
LLYISVIIVIFVTAGEIPLFASLRGASQQDLFEFRESFLKKRQGWEASLAYIVTIIDSAIFPYIVIYAYNSKYKLRHVFLGSFVLYSLSFLEKAYFFKIALPLFIYFYFNSKSKKLYLMVSGSLILGLVFLMFLVSKFDGSEVVRDDPFFSVMHTPQGVGNALLWRSAAVPVITASQGMELFYTEYKGEYLFGATSSSLSALFGLERNNFERVLYQSQFGGEETGNANQCYLVEAFINFGYLGVFIFSLLIGALVKGIIRTKDVAALCILPLFIYDLFNSGLISNLLSNGFLLFFLMFRFVKIK